MNGWRRRAAHSAGLLTAGVLVSVVLSYALSAWAPVALAFDTDSQIVSRVSPSLPDMVIAVAPAPRERSPLSMSASRPRSLG